MIVIALHPTAFGAVVCAMRNFCECQVCALFFFFFFFLLFFFFFFFFFCELCQVDIIF